MGQDGCDKDPVEYTKKCNSWGSGKGEIKLGHQEGLRRESGKWVICKQGVGFGLWRWEEGMQVED